VFCYNAKFNLDTMYYEVVMNSML